MSKELSTPSSHQRRERRSSNQYLRPFLAVLVIGLISCQSIGCSSDLRLSRRLVHKRLDRRISDYRDIVWARRAFNLRYSNCDRDYSQHFENGFVDGYSGVCNGGNGYVPAMPPENYWGTEYRSTDGAKCVNAWFEGYPAGALAAKKDGAGAFHDYYISKMVNSAVVQDELKKSLDLAAPSETTQQLNPTPSSTNGEASPPVEAPEFDRGENRFETGSTNLPMPMMIQSAQYSESSNN